MHITQPRPLAPAATQAVTVVQPAETALTVNVGAVSAWAVAIAAIAAIVTLAYKLLTRDLSRDIGDVRHKLGNTTTRVDALEHARTEDIVRIVKMETALSGIKEGQERLERTINSHFDTLAASIREIRHVEPR